ncbi:MAG TPA: hypothetical protein VEL07_03055 [Planctomycetota bacterium]|nr:hypothetical protein [Planctomycetota bacterium]
MSARHGTVLIAVAGLAAILMSLAVAFLARMRTDADEAREIVADAQARIMLVAACQYVQETARIGWDDPATPEHEECCGWIDVRDGAPGPKTLGDRDPARPENDHPLDRWGDRVYRRDADVWPNIGGVMRAPVHRLHRPPSAILPIAARNPIVQDPTSPDFGMPYLRRPDPVPAAADPAGWQEGDLEPVTVSAGRSWFRLLRLAPARFLVTCGAGATQGFRDWSEVEAAGAQGQFGDAAAFADVAQQDRRMWYVIEWSASCGDTYGLYNNHGGGERAREHYRWRPFNASMDGDGIGQSLDRNLGGTIRWVQRLDAEPAAW